MIVKTKEVYKCEYCRKLYEVRRFAEQHETRCHKNPANHRDCSYCIHSCKKDVVIYEDAPWGEVERQVSAWYCSKLNHYLIPPIAEHKGNAYELDPDINVAMPKIGKCKYMEGLSDLNLIDGWQ